MSKENFWENRKSTNTKKPNNKTKQQKESNKKNDKAASTLLKFEEIHNTNVEKAKIFTEACDSSSEEEDLNDDNILDSVFKSYAGEEPQLKKIQEFLNNFLQSGSSICLICIGTVKRVDSIWSCKSCYCFFHLPCIQRWANDSIFQQKNRSEQEQGYYRNDGTYVPKTIKSIKWYCPKCRNHYDPADVPKYYTCFCEKELNPPHHPWLIPHSCGEACGKDLTPFCGHKCLLLCHPGPCPQCPQNIIVSCKCGRSEKKAIRCFQKSWTCNTKCQKLLACGIHKCESLCHDQGKCPPCTKKSKQKCECGEEVAQRNCYELKWKCKKICNKYFPCGIHKCEVVCHAGDCGPCPKGLPRSCPCGKTKSLAPCNEEVDTCGDTCQKKLACNEHFCAERCHKGECSLCLIITQKKCRCGLHTKELPCSKSFTCETKCKQMRDCKKHICNKKCCDGQCPSCDKICGKSLTCRKHKCKSVCHDGPCYPCELKSQVKCRCGYTSITVPCGRERKIRPPRCNQPCRIPTKCHHQNPHRCHMNDCPVCVQKCNLRNDTTKCEHPCEAKCHDAVKVPITERSNSTNIWNIQLEDYEIKKLPHPKCEVKVSVGCIGGHEVALWPCWNSKPTSCGRKCNRELKCGNHVCQRECHSVVDVTSKLAQENCEKCEEGCKIPRPAGCPHPCPKPCHLPPCQPCTAVIKTNCHCGLSQVYYKCAEYYSLNKDESSLLIEREKLRSCGNRCIKNYPCGHRCTAVCHSGLCPNPDQCRKKVKIYCECKNLKGEISCDKYRLGTVALVCNESCSLKRETRERIEQEERDRIRKIEEERNRIELEQFERKFGKKKYRERKRIEENVNDDKNMKIWISIGTLTVVFISILSYFIFN